MASSSKVTRVVTGTILALRAHAQRNAMRYAAVSKLSPLLGGPLFIVIPPTEAEFFELCKRYLAVVILFTAWEVMIRTAVRIRTAGENADGTKGQGASVHSETGVATGTGSRQPPTQKREWRLSGMDKLRLIISMPIVFLTG
ncbi:MAG: hypothetical protein EBZ48_01655, partial [Proteobacteria bacterium]|nr:hypothetical protein [Pseudomonadota bacterium]